MVVAVAGGIALALFLRSPFGLYVRGFVDFAYLKNYVAAEEAARRIVSADPGSRYAPYALLASSLALQDRTDEALAVMEEAATLFPGDDRAHSKRCRFGVLYGDAAGVLDSCERAVALAPQRQFNYERRAAARALTGDTAGAIEDLDYLLSDCGDAPADAGGRCPVLADWRAQLQAGANPFADGAHPR